MPLYSFPHIKDMNIHIVSHKKRFFVHIDFDAFYAQVEQRDNIKLRGKPVSVGGTEGGKGIVMTASYEARAMGVDTGMSVLEAKRICPDLISVPCYGPKYESIMLNLLSALKDYVPDDCIEQYSIDECFADLSGVVKNFYEATKVSNAIKRKILELENLTASMGISYNKTFAKLATKLQKPNGLSVVTQENKEKIYSMPANKLWGIGRRIEVRLHTLGIKTIGELAVANERMLKKEFGINGVIFRKLARGEDTSEIIRKEKKEKSLNHYHTMAKPIYKTEEVRKEIRRIGEYICRKLRSKELTAGCMHLSIRFENLTYTSHLVKLPEFTNDDREMFNAAAEIYNRKLHKPREEMKARQFGMGVYDLHTDMREHNLNLFEKKVFLPYYALDKIKTKYGEGIIRVGLES
ncbi:MAG TPA: DNA polymerase IV [Ignavibacteria bacterium]|nr:DNA polymerase IV [Ignavibacteria bacterium]